MMRLKELRKEASLTQQELCDKTGIRLGTLRTWEQGASTMRADDVVVICTELGCTPNDLLGWYEDHPQDAPILVGENTLEEDEIELLSNYRECSPLRKRRVTDAAKDQKDLSKNKL